MLRRRDGIEIGRTAATYTGVCFQKNQEATRRTDENMAETAYIDRIDEKNIGLTKFRDK